MLTGVPPDTQLECYGFAHISHRAGILLLGLAACLSRVPGHVSSRLPGRGTSPNLRPALAPVLIVAIPFYTFSAVCRCNWNSGLSYFGGETAVGDFQQAWCRHGGYDSTAIAEDVFMRFSARSGRRSLNTPGMWSNLTTGSGVIVPRVSGRPVRSATSGSSMVRPPRFVARSLVMSVGVPSPLYVRSCLRRSCSWVRSGQSRDCGRVRRGT